MDKDALTRYFDQHYIPRRDLLPRIPLGINPEEFWREILGKRQARSTALPIHGPHGTTYWYVTTDRMISASETIIEEMLTHDDERRMVPPALSPLEEVFYTSYVEGSPMMIQAAMEFLQSGQEPGTIEEQMIANNKNALNFAASNYTHPIDEEFIQMLAYILTQNMDGGGHEYRTENWIEIPSMMDESYEVPAANSLPDCIKELTNFLADPYAHPLIKAAVAQAWVMVVRPFAEGNERLARLLSTVILIRAGYTFFGKVSISAIIARDGYPYYNAIANILRAENAGDLTFFVEHYLVLLERAVIMLREAPTEEIEPPESFFDAPSAPKSESISEKLAADGFIDITTVGETQTGEGGETHWSGERRVREELRTLIAGQGLHLPAIARLLLNYLDDGRYSFTALEVRDEMGINIKQTHNLLYSIRSKGIIEQIESTDSKTVYTFSSCDLSESDYAPEMINSLNELVNGSTSMKDKRIGTMILQHLSQGYITIKDYEATGDESRWAEDMKLAEQMGFVKRITKERCVILCNAQPCFEMLDNGQKKRAKLMYDTFGEDTFSLEMVVATLDYSSSTASAYLHQFTLLRILDCRKEDVNLYQFLVNPKEHPEVFEEIA